jgi:AcrR family transcriptional regulator
MRAVAADAGVALPTIVLAFGTKARLLKAVIDQKFQRDVKVWNPRLRNRVTRALCS